MLRYISVTHVVKLQRSVLARNLPDGPFWLDEGDADAATTVIEINAPPQNHITSMYASRLLDFGHERVGYASYPNSACFEVQFYLYSKCVGTLNPY